MLSDFRCRILSGNNRPQSVEMANDQGQRALSEQRGLQVRLRLLLRQAHTHGQGEARGGVQKCRRRQGISGATPGSRPAFIAMGHLYFDTVADFQSAFGPHAKTIMADIPNYTDIEPTLQISDVKI